MAEPKKKRKTRESWGRLRQLPSGRYQATYQGPDLAIHKAVSTFETMGDARAWLQHERGLVDAGTWTPPKLRNIKKAVPTFGEYSKAWLAGRELKPSTRALYRRHLAAHFEDLNELPVDAITAAHVRAWYSTIDPIKKTMRAQVYGLLRTIMTTAVDDELISINPCRIRGAGSAKRERGIKIATVVELDLLAAALPSKYSALVYIGAWCGLRWGELTELRRSDIELTQGRINVDRAVARVDGEWVIGEPKSKAGIRTIAMPPHLVPIIAAHLREHVGPCDDSLLFPAMSDPRKHLSQGGFRHVWVPACQVAGIPGFHVHDLRHVGATQAAWVGATTAELMRRIGHSTPAMAMRYQHAVDERDSEIAALLSRLVGQ